MNQLPLHCHIVWQTLSNLITLLQQIITAVPYWFRCHSFAGLNSSFRFCTWVEQLLNRALLASYYTLWREGGGGVPFQLLLSRWMNIPCSWGNKKQKKKKPTYTLLYLNNVIYSHKIALWKQKRPQVELSNELQVPLLITEDLLIILRYGKKVLRITWIPRLNLNQRQRNVERP